MVFLLTHIPTLTAVMIPGVCIFVCDSDKFIFIYSIHTSNPYTR